MSNKFELKRQNSDSQFNRTGAFPGFDMYDTLYFEEDEVKEDRFDKQELLVGSGAKQKFWELYKSERKFKDVTPN